MPIEHDAILMRIYLSESHRRSGRTLYRSIIEAMLEHGFRGAAAFKGIEGFGSHRRISSERVPEAPGDLPILIEVLDEENRVHAFLPRLASLLDDGLVTLERIQRVVYRVPADSARP